MLLRVPCGGALLLGQGPLCNFPCGHNNSKTNNNPQPTNTLTVRERNSEEKTTKEKEKQPSHVYSHDKISIFVSLEKNVVDIKLAGPLSAKMSTISAPARPPARTEPAADEDEAPHADEGATHVVKQSPINNASVSDCLASRTGGGVLLNNWRSCVVAVWSLIPECSVQLQPAEREEELWRRWTADFQVGQEQRLSRRRLAHTHTHTHSLTEEGGTLWWRDGWWWRRPLLRAVTSEGLPVTSGHLGTLITSLSLLAFIRPAESYCPAPPPLLHPSLRPPPPFIRLSSTLERRYHSIT